MEYLIGIIIVVLVGFGFRSAWKDPIHGADIQDKAYGILFLGFILFVILVIADCVGCDV